MLNTNTQFVVAIRFGLYWLYSMPQAFIKYLLYEMRSTKMGKDYEGKKWSSKYICEGWNICIWKIIWELRKYVNCMVRNQAVKSSGGVIKDFIDWFPLRISCQINIYIRLIVHSQEIIFLTSFFFVAYNMCTLNQAF